MLNTKTGLKHKRARQCLALLALILVLFIPFQLLSQSEFNYFEKRIDLTGGYDKPLDVLPVEQGYCIGTITQDTFYHYFWQIAFALIDSTGNLTQIKQYGDTSSLYMLGNPGSLIKFSANKYYAVGNIISPYDDWVYNRGLLMCLNNDFDTLWTKEYGEIAEPLSDTQFVIFQVNKTINSKLINTGGRMPTNDPCRIWLLKTDSLGNKLWERFYGEGNEYFQGHSVVQTNDGGYVIGAYKFVIGQTDTGDPLIIKTDSLGNEEWTINPGNPYVSDNKVMIALAQDGNIIAGTNYGTEQSVDNRWAVVKIMKITPDGTVLWDNNYLEPQFDNYLLNTTVLSNGNIITNGSFARFDNGPSIVSYILCIDSTGNQLWYKEYALLTGDNSFNDLYDVCETFDGGLIGVGKVSPVVPDTGTPDIWVMKMDSVGCLWAGCDTTVIINNTLSGYNGFVVYPVPATNRLTLRLPEETPKSTLFTIYNILGTKVKTIALPRQKQTVTINTTKLPPGVYLGVLTVKGKVTGKRKFIVKH